MLACPVWHFNITYYLCKDIELQKRALKRIVSLLSLEKGLELCEYFKVVTGYVKFFKNTNFNPKRMKLLPKKIPS